MTNSREQTNAIPAKPHPPANVDRPTSHGHLHEVLEDVSALVLDGASYHQLSDTVETEVTKERGQGRDEKVEAVEGELGIALVEIFNAPSCQDDTAGGLTEEIGHLATLAGDGGRVVVTGTAVNNPPRQEYRVVTVINMLYVKSP